jgi:hypothetical protein
MLICFLLFSNLVYSQQQNDSIIGASLLLFPKFTEGKVILQDGSLNSALLNYDTYTDQMQFLGDNNLKLTFAEPQNVLMVEIENRRFFYIMNHFAELISDDPVPLYVRIHQQRIADRSGSFGSGTSGSRIQNVSRLYSVTGREHAFSEVNEEVTFEKNFIFYVTTNGITRIVLNRKDFLKCFSKKKGLIYHQLEKQNTKFDSIESVKKIIDWINANEIRD